MPSKHASVAAGRTSPTHTLHRCNVVRSRCRRDNHRRPGWRRAPSNKGESCPMRTLRRRTSSRNRTDLRCNRHPSHSPRRSPGSGRTPDPPHCIRGTTGRCEAAVRTVNPCRRRPRGNHCWRRNRHIVPWRDRTPAQDTFSRSCTSPPDCSGPLRTRWRSDIPVAPDTRRRHRVPDRNRGRLQGRSHCSYTSPSLHRSRRASSPAFHTR